MMKVFKLVCVLGLILGFFPPCFAEQTKRIAAISDTKGTVEVKIGKEKWVAAKTGMELNQGDLIRTRKDSWALINLDGEAQTATVELKENGQLKMTALSENKNEQTQNTLLDLGLGEILIEAKKLHSEKSKFEVKTPTSIVGVRGTTFSVSVEVSAKD
ncbi:MAG: FecR family protein [Candidatus Omnitrophota bacterium]|nr:FecR family protein [Candidatus Omnitrophota bacterium]